MADDLAIGKLNFLPDRLHGRSNEVDELKSIYSQVCDVPSHAHEQAPDSSAVAGGLDQGHPSHSHRQRHAIALCGLAGSGKTSLAQSLKRRAKRDGNHCVSGSFDPSGELQQQTASAARPYSGIVDAIGDLAEQLQSKDDKDVEAIRTDLRKEMSVDVALALARVVPALGSVLGISGSDTNSTAPSPLSNKPASTSIAANEFKNQLPFALQLLVRNVCSSANALVMVFDDMHYVDGSSIELITSLAADEDSPGLLVVCVYQSDGNKGEGTNNPHLSAFLESLEEMNTIDLHRISIGNLDLEAVNLLLADALRCEEDGAKDLAEIVYKKTGGNAISVVEFAKSLVPRKLLTFNLGSFRWIWDIDGISALPVSDNVSELFRRRILTLPPATTQLLWICSCLGTTFRPDTIGIVVEALQEEQGHSFSLAYSLLSPSDVSHTYEGLLEQGILERRGQDLTFAHRQLRSASFMLIPQEVQSELQYTIGRALVNRLSEEQNANMLFVTTNLLNFGIESNPGTLIDLARRNLTAGKKAFKMAAFGVAAAYFKTSIACINRQNGESRWDCHSELLEEAYQAAAMCEGQLGNYEAMQRFLDEIFDNVKPREARMQAYCTQALSYIARGEFHMCFELVFEAVEGLLGEKIPHKPTAAAIFFELIRTKRLLKQYPTQKDILQLPAMEDQTMILGMKLLEQLVAASWAVEPKLFPLILFKMVQMTIRYGLCVHSAGSFAAYGTVTTGFLKDLKRGHEYGQLGIAVLKKMEKDEVDGVNAEYAYTAVTSGQCASYQLHAVGVSKDLRRAYQIGMSSGDTTYSFHCLNLSLMLSFFSGMPLPSIIDKMRKSLSQMRYYSQEYAYARLGAMLQAILNMSGEENYPDDPCSLSGTVFGGESAFRDNCEKHGIGYLKYTLHLKQMLSYLFGNMSMAMGLSDGIVDYAKKYAPGHLLAVRFTLFDALVALEVLQHAKIGCGIAPHGVRKWRNRKNIRLRTMRFWVSNGNPNAVHALLLLEAEVMALKSSSDHDAVRAKYDEAIKAAAKAGALQDQALSAQRAGIYFVEKDAHWSSNYLAKAYVLWSEYGAMAIAQHLANEYPQYISSSVKKSAAAASMRQVLSTKRSSTHFEKDTFEELTLEELTSSAGGSSSALLGSGRNISFMRGSSHGSASIVASSIVAPSALSNPEK